MRIIAFIIVSFLGGFMSVYGQQAKATQEKYYGTVLEVNGTASVNIEPQKLNYLKAGVRLYGKQVISCLNKKGDCNIKVNVCDVRPGRIVIREGATRRIPATDCRPVTEELLNFRAGGRNERQDRGESWFSPSDIGVFQPQTLVIRWVPYAPGTRLSFSLHDEDGVKIWMARNIDGAKGLFSPRSLHDALQVAQEKEHLSLALSLKIVRAGSDPRLDEIRFNLISSQTHRKLQDELVPWRSTDVMYHPARAAIFARYQLFTDSAAELEQVLDISPTDPDLLRMTISAESYALNRARVVALCRRLKRVVPNQEHCSCLNRCQ